MIDVLQSGTAREEIVQLVPDAVGEVGVGAVKSCFIVSRRICRIARTVGFCSEAVDIQIRKIDRFERRTVVKEAAEPNRVALVSVV